LVHAVVVVQEISAFQQRNDVWAEVRLAWAAGLLRHFLAGELFGATAKNIYVFNNYIVNSLE